MLLCINAETDSFSRDPYLMVDKYRCKIQGLLHPQASPAVSGWKPAIV